MQELLARLSLPFLLEIRQYEISLLTDPLFAEDWEALREHITRIDAIIEQCASSRADKS